MYWWYDEWSSRGRTSPPLILLDLLDLLDLPDLPDLLDFFCLFLDFRRLIIYYTILLKISIIALKIVFDTDDEFV